MERQGYGKKPDVSWLNLTPPTEEEKARWDEIEWHRPELRADYRTWAHRPYWSAEECVALTLGKDPHQVNWDAIQHSGSIGYSPFCGDYEILRDRILEAQTNKELPERIPPVEFFAWARQQKVVFPDALEWAVSTNEADIEQLEQQNEQLRQRNENLRSENQKLRYELDRLRDAAIPVQKNGLSTKERSSLLKMVIAMAMELYGHVPGRRGTAAKNIANEIENRRMRLDEDTCRRYLKEAEEELPWPNSV